ncbi:MAG: hypothetical protein HY536_02295 [Candidatus Colwellbacteria bacterium]|nr:hypothetical protein [Candidatus Colwellbacteria bacterium]
MRRVYCLALDAVALILVAAIITIAVRELSRHSVPTIYSSYSRPSQDGSSPWTFNQRRVDRAGSLIFYFYPQEEQGMGNAR